MPYRTLYGSHYHMTYGCHGATIPCDTAGLTPCSDCCGSGGGGGSWGGGDGSGPSGSASAIPVGTAVSAAARDIYGLEESAEERDARESGRLRRAKAREGTLMTAASATEVGASPTSAPTMTQQEVLDRIASLEAELQTLRAQVETESAIPSASESNPYAVAERDLDESMKDLLDKFWNGRATPELYAEEIVDRVSALSYEVTKEMAGMALPGHAIDEADCVRRLADRLEAEGYGDKLDAEVVKRLGWDGEDTAIQAIGIVRQRRAERGTPEAPSPAEALRKGGDASAATETPARVAAAERELGGADEGSSRPAKKPARRRAAKKSDPMKGMTPQQEHDAFEQEFSTKETEAYMGAKGYEGSKSHQNLYGSKLSSAVRSDLKEWLGHLGVPRSAVKVASHTYSGGQSLKVQTKLDRKEFGPTESEFKSAYRRHFWYFTPDWGTVRTSRGEVDVSVLMDGQRDTSALMEDIIDTAWREYDSGQTEVDCGSKGKGWVNPRHELYLNEKGREVARRMQRIVDAYNYDDSNGMVDYFSSGFYSYPSVVLS